MKKKLLAFFFALSLAVNLCACQASFDMPDAKNVDAPDTKDLDTRAWELLSDMTVEEKLSQMMIVALRCETDASKKATVLSPAYATLLSRFNFGGILLFADNIVDTAQTVTLIRDCQDAAMRSSSGIPMLFCVDQEGGLVNRVDFGVTGCGNMALAATGDTALTETCASMLGEEIRALGFTVDFAPVADVNNNPNNPIIGVRSFSDDPLLSARHVAAFLRGLNKSGVAAALKHFPGHGNVGEDSHTHLPLSPLTTDELKACELIPFRAGIDEGAEIIMTAHIQYPNIETDTYRSRLDGETVYLPATLSRRIITGLLRNELGYDGLVVTDAFDMAAIHDHFDAVDAASLAIRAGVDFLLCPINVYQDENTAPFEAVSTYMETLLARVKEGEIPESELDDSVLRILKFKLKQGLYAPLPPLDEAIAKAASSVGSAAHHEKEWEIAQRGLTLLKNEGDTLPFSSGHTLILSPNTYRLPTIEYALDRLESEGKLDRSQVTVLSYNKKDASLQRAVQEASQVILLSQSVKRDASLAAVIDTAHREGCRVALLSLYLPYDAAFYTDCDAILCAYNPYGSAHDEKGRGPFNLNVAVALCAAFGQAVPQGHLPVNIPYPSSGTSAFSETLCFPRGFGLKNWGS